MTDSHDLKRRMDNFLDGFDENITMHTEVDSNTERGVDRVAGKAAGPVERSPLLGPYAECDVNSLSVETRHHLHAYQKNGCVIIPDVVQGSQLVHLQQETKRLFANEKFGDNSFYGNRTKRFYSALAKTRAFDPVIASSKIEQMVRALFFPNALLAAMQVIEIHPGEKQQKLHFDQQFSAVRPARKGQYFIVNFLVAIDDFTSENGATVFIPESHRWPSDRVPTTSDRLQRAEMKAGDCFAFSGELWHAGGANTSSGVRRCVLFVFQEPWLRPLENFFLSVPFPVAASLPKHVISYLGYSLCHPFVGQVDFQHPIKKLNKLVAKM